MMLGGGVIAFGWMCLEDDTTRTHAFEDHEHALLKKWFPLLKLVETVFHCP